MASEANKSFPLWGKWLIYIIIFSAVGALIVKQLPSGAYPTDLTRVGQGKPALVLVYDVNTANGMHVMELLKDLRLEYADRVEFLVANLGLPEGRSFAQHYKVGSGSVFMFKRDGELMRTIRKPESTAALQQALDEVISTPSY